MTARNKPLEICGETVNPGESRTVNVELPLVHEGEALFHIAVLEDPGSAAEVLDNFHEVHASDEDPDEEARVF